MAESVKQENTMIRTGKRHPLNELAAAIKRAQKDAKSKDPLAREGNNQNILAWFGFEETARKLYESAEREQEDDEDADGTWFGERKLPARIQGHPIK